MSQKKDVGDSDSVTEMFVHGALPDTASDYRPEIARRIYKEEFHTGRI